MSNNLSQTVSRIDPAVDRVVQTIPVGNAPDGVAIGDGSVWVANSSDGTVSRIDSVNGDVVGTIPLGAGATDVAVGQGAVWVSDEGGDRVFRVDPQDNQVTASINVGAGPTAITLGFGSVWVANSLDGTVSRIDPQTNSVTATVAVGDGVGGIAVGAGHVWVSSQYAGTLSLINPVADVVKRTIKVGNRPEGVALTHGLVWIGAGPADTGHRGGTLRVLATGHADTVDPILTQNLYPILSLSYDGLTADQRVGGSGSVQLVPDLAVSLPAPTEGGTTYTFQLRRGIRYSNGDLLRPEDFRRGLERGLILGGNTNYGSPFAEVIGGAACAAHPSHCDLSRGVVTNDTADTVTFHLLAPDPEFLDRLTLPDAYPVPPGIPDHDIGLRPMPATGAYKWVGVSRNALTLVRNPYFREWSHAARPDGYPDRIVFRGNVNWEAGVTAVERGTADYMFDGVPPDRMAEAQTRFAGRLYINPSSSITALILNTRSGAVHRRTGAASDQLRRRSRRGRSAPRRGLPARLPDPARRPSRIPPLLPVHDRPGLGRNLVRPKPRSGQAPDRRLTHAWNPDHDLEPRRTNPCAGRSLSRLAPRSTRLPDPDQGLLQLRPVRPSALRQFTDGRSSRPLLDPLRRPVPLRRAGSPERIRLPSVRPGLDRPTQTGPSSATTGWTHRSTAPSPPRATTRRTPRRYGHRPTGPQRTKPRSSR